MAVQQHNARGGHVERQAQQGGHQQQRGEDGEFERARGYRLTSITSSAKGDVEGEQQSSTNGGSGSTIIARMRMTRMGAASARQLTPVGPLQVWMRLLRHS